MADIPYKVYKGSDNGKAYYTILPGTNTPVGLTESNINEANQWYETNKSNPAYQSAIEEYSFVREKRPVGTTAVVDQYVAPWGETLTNIQPSQIQAIQQEQQQAQSGQLVNTAPTGTPPLYVPKGSAGDLQQQGVPIQQQLQTPSVQQQIQQQGLQPSMPVQPTQPSTVAPVATTSSTATPTPQGAVSPPNVSLQPGATGMEVKKLQDYLVSIGLMTAEDVATGPGIYGPKTTAAVLALQQKLGVDNSTGPGYFGPKTISAILQGAGVQDQGTQNGLNGQSSNQKPPYGTSDAGLQRWADENPEAFDDWADANGWSGNTASRTGTTPPPPAPMDFAKTYTDTLSALGIPSIKQQFEKVTKEYSDLQNELNDKIADINDNPWLTEGTRVSQIRKLQERYEGKMGILTNQQKIYDSLYQEGVAQAKFLTTGEVAQQERVFELAQARIEAENKLKQSIVENQYDHIKEVNGGLFNMDSGEWIVQPKPQGSDDLLSPTEAQSLGVPYGTTKRQASQMGITPNNGGFGNYSEDQVKAITKINQDVSKNATYTKTSSMRNYADNVIASLGVGNGVSDIAAINQFQKVIDEGAVTRDQDVALIQSAQSLVGTLFTKVKELEKGDKLSTTQRTQMKDLVEKLYEAQVKALLKDPYIAAKEKEASLYGIGAQDTILGELGSLGSTNDSGGGEVNFEWE